MHAHRHTHIHTIIRERHDALECQEAITHTHITSLSLCFSLCLSVCLSLSLSLSLSHTHSHIHAHRHTGTRAHARTREKDAAQDSQKAVCKGAIDLKTMRQCTAGAPDSANGAHIIITMHDDAEVEVCVCALFEDQFTRVHAKCALIVCAIRGSVYTCAC